MLFPLLLALSALRARDVGHARPPPAAGVAPVGWEATPRAAARAAAVAAIYGDGGQLAVEDSGGASVGEDAARPTEDAALRGALDAAEKEEDADAPSEAAGPAAGAIQAVQGGRREVAAAHRQPVVETAFSTKARRVYRQAMKDLQASETKRIMAYLNKTAHAFGETTAKYEAKRQAGVATRRAFRATRRITSARAEAYCQQLSHLTQMKHRCYDHAGRLLDTLHRGRLAAWETAAEAAAVAPTARASAKAGLEATRQFTTTQVGAVTRRISKRLFQLWYPRFKAKWDARYNEEMRLLSLRKIEFFQNATRMMIRAAEAPVKKAIWTRPVAAALKRIQQAAAAQAPITARRAAARAVAPRFVKAAQAALPVAVRAAHKQALAEWQPGWVPRDPEVQEDQFWDGAADKPAV